MTRQTKLRLLFMLAIFFIMNTACFSCSVTIGSQDNSPRIEQPRPTPRLLTPAEKEQERVNLILFAMFTPLGILLAVMLWLKDIITGFHPVRAPIYVVWLLFNIVLGIQLINQMQFEPGTRTLLNLIMAFSSIGICVYSVSIFKLWEPSR